MTSLRRFIVRYSAPSRGALQASVPSLPSLLHSHSTLAFSCCCRCSGGFCEEQFYVEVQLEVEMIKWGYLMPGREHLINKFKQNFKSHSKHAKTGNLVGRALHRNMWKPGNNRHSPALPATIPSTLPQTQY